MIVDSSAVIAVLKGELDSEAFMTAMLDAPCSMSIANWVESSLVADNDNAVAADALEQLVEAAEIELVPVTIEQGRAARVSHRRFGRGSGSPAKLNFGDCFAYALAIDSGEPLLYQGTDFDHTDVRSARDE